MDAKTFVKQIITGYGKEGRNFLNAPALTALVEARDRERRGELKARLERIAEELNGDIPLSVIIAEIELV